MNISTSETKEVVLGLGNALNDENYDAARRYVSDNMKYVGPSVPAMEPKHTFTKSNAFV